MKTLTLEELRAVVQDRFDGVIEAGKHEEKDEACVLECYSVAQGIEWTDDPVTLRTWDLRPLNDIAVSPAVRTRHIIPVLVAYQGSLDWPAERQAQIAARLVILTVQRIISELPGLSDDLQRQCRQATTLKEAKAAAAAGAAWELGVEAAAWAAEAAARAAERAASWAAAKAAKATQVAGAAWAAAGGAKTAEREKFFILACGIYLEAVKSEERGTL